MQNIFLYGDLNLKFVLMHLKLKLFHVIQYFPVKCLVKGKNKFNRNLTSHELLKLSYPNLSLH